MKYSFKILLVSGFLGLISCGEDTEKPKDIIAESAEWSVVVDEELVEGDELELIYVTDAGYRLTASQTDGLKYIEFTFFKEPKVRSYTSDGDVRGNYYLGSGIPDGLNEGQLTIIKYNADSLVATFSYDTYEHRVLTNGVIKARLR